MMKRYFIFLFMITVLGIAAQAASVRVVRQLVMSQENPVGVGTRTPDFSWRLESGENDVLQTAWQITVASNEGDLLAGKNLLWNSGRVEGRQNVCVPIDKAAGETLRSGCRYYWNVRVWTSRGEAEGVPQQFTMALLDDADWQAKWIGVESSYEVRGRSTVLPARYLRKEFKARGGVKRAMLYISGLGNAVYYLNGSPVSDEVLGPLPSWYPTAVNYQTYDVTRLVNAGGDNALAVLLGNGRYLACRTSQDNYIFGLPRMIAQLVIEDEAGVMTVVSDGTWRATDRGPVRENSEYDGEHYDARMELGDWTCAGFDDSAWRAADVMRSPTKHLRAQPSPDIAVQEEFKAKSVRCVAPRRYIVDMGQNFVGWVRVTLRGASGEPVTLRHAETLQKGGTELYVDNLVSALATDVYIPASDGVFTWAPQLTYQGFRYLEVTGVSEPPSLDDFTACVAYDKMRRTGSFECGNDVLNGIYRNAYWGIRSNYRGMPTDCPQRDERQGWLGDRSTGCFGESLVFDNHLLYNKWLQDIEESMSTEGDIPDVAPRFWTRWTQNVTWPSAFFYGAEMTYRHFGDRRAIIERYPAMRKYINFVKTRLLRDGVVIHDTYGDWCMPPESPEMIHSKDPARVTDGRILSTTVYYDLLRLMIDFARISGNEADIPDYERMRAEIREGYNRQFYNRDLGGYDNNTVTANILSLRLGLVPDGEQGRVLENIRKVTDGPMFNGHISVGVLGVQHLMRGLSRNGYTDLAYRIATNDTYPSWGYMLRQDATTIWELWNGDTGDPAMNSGNHVMLLGDLLIWMMEDLAGIANAGTGFDEIVMQPCFPDGLDHASATFDSPQGMIKSAWRRNGDSLTWDITVPANTSARVVVPERFGIKAKAGKKGIHSVTTDAGNTIITLGSGSYHLQSGK